MVIITIIQHKCRLHITLEYLRSHVLRITLVKETIRLNRFYPGKIKVNITRVTPLSFILSFSLHEPQ